MRWYFAIDEAGGNSATGQLAKLAVLSARAVGGLNPYLLYYGGETDFTAWMRANSVSVIAAEPTLLSALRAAEVAGRHRLYTVGHWLRLNIPLVERDEEFVLYTDCDVVFLRPYDWSRTRPRVLAAAPEFGRDNWNYFNSGVMLLNVPAMRQTYPEFEAHVVGRLSEPASFNYDDQVALNDVYRTYWERLDTMLNWKPYWGYNTKAAILHFHGPKPEQFASIAGGNWAKDQPAGLMLARLLDAHKIGYEAWCTVLGDQLQNVDLHWALRFHAAASVLARYRPASVRQEDLVFMNHRPFAER